MPQSSKQHYCLGFIFCAGNGVLLIRKARPDWQRGKLNGIGGHVEPGEAPLAAMRREFKEETGIRWEPWEYFFVMEFPDAVVHCYRAEAHMAFSIEPQYTNGEEPVHWIDLDLLSVDTGHDYSLPNLRWLVPLAKQFKDFRRGGPFVQKS